MEDVQARVQHAINKMIVTLDKEVLRKAQIDMYKCSTKCCETLDSMEDVQRCVGNCSKPLTLAQGVVEQELNSYQERLKRCSLDCNDAVRDKMGKNPSDTEIARYRNDVEQCVVKCGETHIALVPLMMKRIKETIQRS